MTMSKNPPTGGMDLVIYQIGEVKNLVENLTVKSDNFQEKIDKRVSALEIWQAGEKEKDDSSPKIDIQKIILAAFGLIAAALAIFQTLK